MSDEDKILHTQIANMGPQFQKALPAHITVDRFSRVLTTAVSLNPKLLKCDRISLLAAATRAAEDGLLPDGRQGVIVERKGKAYWQPMVAGVRTKARNSGELSSWDVQAVFENDSFDYDLGDQPFVTHKFDLKAPRGDLVAVYSIAKFRGGGKSIDVMPIADVYAVRDRYSDAYRFREPGKSNAWVDSPAEMAKKTIAHRHAKMLPMSTDMQRTLDNMFAGDMDPRGVAQERHRMQLPPTTLGKLDMLARGSHNEPPPPEPEDIEVDPPQEKSQKKVLEAEKETGDVAREAASPQAAGSPEPPAPPAAAPPQLASDIGRDLMQKLAHNLALARTQKDIDRICTALFDKHPIHPDSPFYQLAANIRLAHMRRAAGESSPAAADSVVAQLLGSISSQ